MSNQALPQEDRTATASPPRAKPPVARSPAAPGARPRFAWAWTAGGYGFFSIGLLGIALPLLPTTIFWVVAAACFAKGCPAMARRIYDWPGFGPAVEAFLDQGVIGRRAKLSALAGIAFGSVVVALLPLPLAGRLITLAVMALSALYVVTRPEAIRPQAVLERDRRR
nr:protein of unknown function (DUF454) [uncultured bacterium]